MGSPTGPKPIVVVARCLLDAGRRRLEEACEIREGGLDVTRDRLRELAAGASAIVADPAVAITEELLAAAGPGLRLIASFSVGYDHIDTEACADRGVMVTTTPDVLTDATAELALALTLAAARRTSEAEAGLRAGRWQRSDPGAHLGLELTGATFGVVGMGRIGRRYAELVAPLAGATLYAGRTARPDAEDELGAGRVELAELLDRADVVSLHLPVSAGTEGLIGVAALRRMRRHAVLVNTARGALVDSIALAAALREERIGGAGLDVYEREPEIPAELLAAPRCVLLPHIGSATTRARERMADLVADSVLAVLHGYEPANRIV